MAAKYFGTTTGIDPDADPDGDGTSTWQEYLNNTDPTDYYNAQLPQLFLVGGGNQRALAGSLLAQPVSIEVNYYGDQNAPLTFTAIGGALLAPDASGTYQPSATVNVRSTGQINLDGSQTYVGQVYVYLPSTANTISTITATATSAGQSVSVSTTAVASDPNVQPPGGLDVAFNTDTFGNLSFSPSDATLPTSVEVSQDEGTTWSTWGVAPAGSTSFTLTGLPPETEVLIRAFTGTDSGGSGNGGNASGAQTNAAPAPSPTSPPTGNTAVTLYLQPHIQGDQVDYVGHNWSYVGFLGPTPGRYLMAKKVTTSTEAGPPDGVQDGGTNTATGTITPMSGYVSDTSSGTGGTDYGGSYVIDSDAAKHRHAVDPDDDSGETSDAVVTLSSTYALDTFKTDSASWWPGPPPLVGFNGAFSPDQNRARLDFRAEGGYSTNDGYVDASYGYDHAHEIEKLQYTWQVNKDPNGHLGFDEVFLPKDGSALKHHVLHWDTKGATVSDPAKPWTLDPLASNGKAEGVYRVLAVELHARGQQDGAGIPGSLVPSIKTDGTGQKHFVVPKKAGGTVTITAVLAGQTEPGMDFESLYEFVPLGANATITSSTCQVKTDNPGEYTVQVRTKDSAHTVIASMNVWVVWAKVAEPTIRLQVKGVGPSYRIGDSDHAVDAFKAVGEAFVTFEIEPPEIITGDDIPKLTGPSTVPVPGATQDHPILDEKLGDGADTKWDISRKVSYRVFNANNLPLEYFDDGIARVYGVTQVPSGTIVPFPSVPALGNDDSNTKTENNNPYEAFNGDARFQHDKGAIASYDNPKLVVPNLVPTISSPDPALNASIVLELDFLAFARLQIGDVWYEVSDLYPWGLILDATATNGVWSDDDGQTTTYPATQ